MRQEHSKNILDDLESWLSKQLTHISGKSPLAGAVRYALTRIPKVRPYLEHGFLELDNNTAERAIAAYCHWSKELSVSRLRERR